VERISTDSRNILGGELFFALKGENLDGHNFISQALANGALGAVVERDFRTEENKVIIKVKDSTKALGDLAKVIRKKLRASVVAITGSNGKTTTKDMVAHILSASGPVIKAERSFNNFVGLPLTIFSATARTDFLVAEMGTSGKGEIARLADIASPDVAVITNISQTHLEGLKDIEGVASAKAELLDGLSPEGLAIVNGDDVWCGKIVGRSPARVITFGLSSEVDVTATDVTVTAGGIQFALSGVRFSLPLLGRFNVYNALAAVAVARRFGIALEVAKERLKTFRAQPMRMQVVKLGPITLINDAYNANPKSMQMALEVLEEFPTRGRRIFVCGDMLELGEKSDTLHHALGERIARGKSDLLFTVGEKAKLIAQGAQESGMPEANIKSFLTVEEAGKVLSAFLEKGDVALLKASRRIGLERAVAIVEDALIKTGVPRGADGTVKFRPLP
jgi:UDP-N-acetylmuramoyl-tripeptide--D-alanyl-D-alanine ligase